MSTVFDKEKNPIRVIGKIIDVDASRKEKQQLIEIAKRDVMTGLYNKLTTEKLISEELYKAEPNSLFAFLFYDIDNFKQINDDFGHIKGDYVLSKISENIKMIFRSSDIIGRVGGDEFVIFIKDLPSEDQALKKAKCVLDIINSNFNIEKDGFNISASIGVSFYNKDGVTYSQLLEKADIALYRSKREGKNTYTVYDSELDKREDEDIKRLHNGHNEIK
jgi:diguanylate cyclase (GGDEF)-like protein